MFTRIGLFLATNIAILAVLSISMRVLGIDQMLAAEGIGMNLTGLLIMAAIIGFAGSFISLALSKFMAKRSMGVKVIEQPSNSNERLAAGDDQPAGAAGGYWHARSGHI